MKAVQSIQNTLTRSLSKLALVFSFLFLANPQAKAQSFNFTSSMHIVRHHHTATLLADGKVLVTGGVVVGSCCEAETSQSEIYDPATASWAITGSMHHARSYHTATLLPNGNVLVVGGGNSVEAQGSYELYDSTTGIWTTPKRMNIGDTRIGYGWYVFYYKHQAVLLPDGKVLVVPKGGSEAEGLYNPLFDTWTNSIGIYSYNEILFSSATVLDDGRVLIVGGEWNVIPTNRAVIYNPSNRTKTSTGSMSAARREPLTTLLPNGKVLVAGGYDSEFKYAFEAELYNPTTGTWATTGFINGLNYERMTLLLNGKVLVEGGEDPRSELYDSTTGVWMRRFNWSMKTARSGHTATLLTNGLVLIAGGLSYSNGLLSSLLSSAEIYDPNGVNTPVLPALGICTYSNQPAVFYPTDIGANYLLQMTTNLSSTNWVTVSNGIPISGLIITNPPANAFFRLY